jgi:hypothetical protein
MNNRFSRDTHRHSPIEQPVAASDDDDDDDSDSRSSDDNDEATG